MFHISLPIKQQTDNFMPTLETSKRESGVAIGLDLGVDVAALVKQELDGGCVAVHCGQHQRRDAQLAAGARVDFRAVVQQQLDDVDVATGGGQAQGGVVGDVAVLLVGSTIQQQLNHLYQGERDLKKLIK